MVAATLSSCSGAATVAGGSKSPAPAALPTPLVTSITTSQGTWVTLPMGDLSQPANTFWQLFYQPTGGTKWSDQISGTAVATNGGVVLASAGGPALIAAILPSGNLTFSPLATTSDAGKTWSDDLVDAALAPRPDALATGSGGQALALVSDHGRTDILSSSDGLSSWVTLATQAGLAASPAGRTCGLASITAAAYLAATPVVGGLCDRPGVVGLFAKSGAGWGLLQPTLAPPPGSTEVEVLAIRSMGGQLAVLLGVSMDGAAQVVAAWTADGGQSWTTSSGLPLGGSATISSYGPVGGDGFFVLTSGSSGAESLTVIDGPGATWSRLVSPPASTATIAAGTPDEIQAFSVKSTVLTVWTLAPAAIAWQKTQVLNVPIEFGSSS